MGRLPAFVPRITTSREPDSRGCRYSLMFRPPSLLAPQIVPTAAILPQGSRGFYVRAYRALLPPHAPDMLTVRIQVIDGTGTFTLSDSQPCRLLTLLCGHYPASSLLQGSPPLSDASVLSASRDHHLCLSLGIVGQVLKFHAKARMRVTPPAHRTPYGQ